MEQILQISGAKTLRLQNHSKFSGFAGPIIIEDVYIAWSKL